MTVSLPTAAAGVTVSLPPARFMSSPPLLFLRGFVNPFLLMTSKIYKPRIIKATFNGYCSISTSLTTSPLSVAPLASGQTVTVVQPGKSLLANTAIRVQPGLLANF